MTWPGWLSVSASGASSRLTISSITSRGVKCSPAVSLEISENLRISLLASGDYWKGSFYRLEAEGFECVLADAKQVKNLPGRPKHDPGDSRWLAACLERGAVTSCFVATPEFRIIRLHTRYRRDLTEERTREKQRAEKLLESAAIKLSSVVTDLHGAPAGTSWTT